MCHVEIIRHVSGDGILYRTFVGLDTTFVGCLLWPSVAVFMLSGLKACGFESQPLYDLKKKNCVSRFKNMFIFVRLEREEYELSSHI